MAAFAFTVESGTIQMPKTLNLEIVMSRGAWLLLLLSSWLA